tara:strand:- start:1086 stop:1388 length:303 start_codon:yes stop_codon:yes gene_type:complete
MTDWQKGDLAELVVAGSVQCPNSAFGWRHRGGNNGAARYRTVAKVSRGPLDDGLECGCARLVFRDGGSGIASRFRKITPPKPTADDREVIDLMAGKKAPA